MADKLVWKVYLHGFPCIGVKQADTGGASNCYSISVWREAYLECLFLTICDDMRYLCSIIRADAKCFLRCIDGKQRTGCYKENGNRKQSRKRAGIFYIHKTII